MNGARPFPVFCPGIHWEEEVPLLGRGVMRDGGWNCQWRAKVGSVETWSFGWLN